METQGFSARYYAVPKEASITGKRINSGRRSRFRSAIFGGTTRYVLANAKLPVLMAH